MRPLIHGEWEGKMGQPLWKTGLTVFKAEHASTIKPSNLHYPEKYKYMLTKKENCIQMFITALFVIAKTGIS